MKVRTVATVLLALVTALPAIAARNWKSGMLMGMEQNKVKEGHTTTYNTDGNAKNKGNKTDYSQNTTATTNDNIETYQIYTIEVGNKVYTASEHLLFPWSKPANVTVGETMKLDVDKNKLYILDDDGKEHKTTITGVKMKRDE
ncbi:MAG: hypothetical protein ACR2JE_12020 [Acidobacteriaceae bacterium]